MKELHGRVAIVTGAARNIGRAIALELAAAGASVVVNALTSKDEIEALAREIGGVGALADVTDEAAVARMVAAALERFGRPDILVNNAAVRAVEPGLIDTVRSSPSAHKSPSLMNRRGTPEEVAGAVRFLAGPGARYITGQTLHVNGGGFLA